MAAATVVPLGTTVSGSALSGSIDDTDYYAIDLPKAGQVGLNFKFPAGLGTGPTYTVSIYNANGTDLYNFDLDGSAADGTWLASQGTFLPAGRAYIRSTANSGKLGQDLHPQHDTDRGDRRTRTQQLHLGRDGGAPGDHGFRFGTQRRHR